MLGEEKNLADFFHSVPSGPTSSECRMADYCGLENFSTFGNKIGNNLQDKKTLLSLQAAMQSQSTIAKHALDGWLRLSGDLAHSELVCVMVRHFRPAISMYSLSSFLGKRLPC